MKNYKGMLIGLDHNYCRSLNVLCRVVKRITLTCQINHNLMMIFKPCNCCNIKKKKHNNNKLLNAFLPQVLCSL